MTFRIHISKIVTKNTRKIFPSRCSSELCLETSHPTFECFIVFFNSITVTSHLQDSFRSQSCRLHCKRTKLPESLPRKEYYLDISDEQKQCECGQEMVKIGEEVSEQLHIKPAQSKRQITSSWWTGDQWAPLRMYGVFLEGSGLAEALSRVSFSILSGFMFQGSRASQSCSVLHVEASEWQYHR